MESAEKIFHRLWYIKSPSIVLSLAWKVLLNRVLMRENLRRRKVIKNSLEAMCPLGFTVEESTPHLFFTCLNSWKIWMQVYKWLGTSMVQHEDGKVHFLQHLSGCSGWGRKCDIWL